MLPVSHALLWFKEICSSFKLSGGLVVSYIGEEMHFYNIMKVIIVLFSGQNTPWQFFGKHCEFWSMDEGLVLLCDFQSHFLTWVWPAFFWRLNLTVWYIPLFLLTLLMFVITSVNDYAKNSCLFLFIHQLPFPCYQKSFVVKGNLNFLKKWNNFVFCTHSHLHQS